MHSIRIAEREPSRGNMAALSLPEGVEIWRFTARVKTGGSHTSQLLLDTCIIAIL